VETAVLTPTLFDFKQNGFHEYTRRQVARIKHWRSGPPAKLTDARLAERLLCGLGDGLTLTMACRRVHLDRKTAYRYRVQDVEFRELVDLARQDGRKARQQRMFERDFVRSLERSLRTPRVGDRACIGAALGGAGYAA
jgi:hypothetical protein